MSVQSSVAQTTAGSVRAVGHSPWPRVASAAAAVGAVPVFALTTLRGDTGAEITAGLAADATTLTIASTLAVLVSAGLFVAAGRLGRVVSGDAGRVVSMAGAAVALMYAAYYSVFGAGGVVADQMLTSPGPGLGEATSLLLNITDITRYAPGLALVAAAVAGRRHLAGGVWVTASVLGVMTIVPLTSWVAALLIPVWLGASAALTTSGTRADFPPALAQERQTA